MTGSPPYPCTPRWVKVSGIVVGGLVLLVVILVHAGGGPRHNIPSASSLGGHTTPEDGH